MKMIDFEKNKTFIRAWMTGRNYFNGVAAMNYAEKFHKGLRKDGQTPEFEHQISQAQFVRTLEPHLIYKEETFVTVFLHDTREDYGIGHEEMVVRFGELAAHAIEKMTKKFRDTVKSKEEYYNALAMCPIASIAKGADRIHNMSSMVGVFTTEKQQSYITEVRDYILPMIKEAKRNFPTQEAAYESVKQMLLQQIDLIEALHAVKSK